MAINDAYATPARLNSVDRITIHRCTEADVERAADLKRTVENETYSTYGTSEEHATSQIEYCSPEYIRKMLQTARVLLATNQQRELLGMIAITGRTRQLQFSALYCRLRGEGIGTNLLRRAMSPAPTQTVVTLEVFDVNAGAIEFFSSFGFRMTGYKRSSESYPRQTLLEMQTTTSELCERLSRPDP